MELSYGFLYKQEVKSALEKLDSASFDGRTAYNIRRIIYECERNFKILQAEFRDLIKKYAVLNEKGEPVEPDERGNFKLRDGVMMDYQKEMIALMNKKFTLERCEQIAIDTIMDSKDLKLSSFDIGVLEPVISGLDLSQPQASDPAPLHSV